MCLCDRFGIETVNLLRASLKNATIQKGDELEEAEVLSVLCREVKQWEEAKRTLGESGASEGAKEAAARLEILEPLLPPGISDEKILEVVDAVIAGMGEAPALGPVMGQVMGQLRERGVDGARVSALVASRLSGEN